MLFLAGQDEMGIFLTILFEEQYQLIKAHVVFDTLHRTTSNIFVSPVSRLASICSFIFLFIFNLLRILDSLLENADVEVRALVAL